MRCSALVCLRAAGAEGLLGKVGRRFRWCGVGFEPRTSAPRAGGSVVEAQAVSPGKRISAVGEPSPLTLNELPMKLLDEGLPGNEALDF